MNRPPLGVPITVTSTFHAGTPGVVEARVQPPGQPDQVVAHTVTADGDIAFTFTPTVAGPWRWRIVGDTGVGQGFIHVQPSILEGPNA